MYLIGIDVGGTFTDGALVKSGIITATAKVATDNNDISNSLFSVLDQLSASVPAAGNIDRIVISTTVVTNLLVTGQVEPVALILLPGYGLPESYYALGEYCYFLQGAIDFRGKEVEKIVAGEVAQCIRTIKEHNLKRIVVAGKFSNRNNSQEKFIRDLIYKEYPEALVLISSEISNQLNFARRIATAYYTAMTYYEWNNFVDSVKTAVNKRGIKAEVQVLKADGGTIPLEASRKYPCQTIFSGPAASTMGAAALTMDKCNSVVIDVGGTTSDISLIIEGEPLYASKGAVINGKYTHVEAFSLTSLPIGGDSPIAYINAAVDVLNQRQDSAVCLGGKILSVTDIFNAFYDLKIGNYEASQSALESFALEYNLNPAETAQQVISIVVNKLAAAINKMFTEWEKEPAYKVWEIVNNRKFELNRIIGIGAASTAIIPVLAKHLQVPYFLHKYSPVANALGAAVARPTINIMLHADTEHGYYTVQPNGGLEKISNTRSFNLEEAKELALNHLYFELANRGIEEYGHEAVFYMEEQFNVIKGWDTPGKIFDIGVQVKPGFIKEFSRGAEA